MRIKAIHYATGQLIALGIEQGVIKSVETICADGMLASRIGKINETGLANADNHELMIVAPGLVDLQINGYAGNDFNQLPISDVMIGDSVRMLWREGVATCFPTVITNTAEAILEAMKTIAHACDRDPVADHGIAGIHLEGPFISPQDGARGAHSRDCVRPPDWDLFCRWQDASGGRIKILTLSPEWPGSARFIARCTENGVTVSIGHTSATPEQIQEAVAAGARMSTHLGNGAHLLLPRHPNYIWEQLAQEQLWSCLIADGFHLPDQVLKVVMKVKGSQAMLVSDAVSLSGLAPGAYTTAVGGKVVLTPEGRLHLAANEQILAGSAQMLLSGIMHLTNRGLADLAEAWDMASVRPAGFMRLPSAAGLTPGAPADLVLFRREGSRIRLAQTYKSGRLVYSGG